MDAETELHRKEEAYQETKQMLERVMELEKQTEEPCKSSPLASVRMKLEDGLSAARDSIIYEAVKVYNQKYTPNKVRNYSDFIEMVKEKQGHRNLNFNLKMIEEVFLEEISDESGGVNAVMKDVYRKIGHIMAHTGWGDTYKRTLNRKGRNLEFNISTYFTKKIGRYSSGAPMWFYDVKIGENDMHGLRALETIIWTLEGNNPMQESKPIITSHLKSYYEQRDGDLLYQKTEVEDELIKSFKFHKNSKVVLECTSEDAAERLEKAIMKGVEKYAQRN